jgi:hypothetical protein
MTHSLQQTNPKVTSHPANQPTNRSTNRSTNKTKQGSGAGGQQQQDETAHLNQFIIHSSLDMLEKAMWTNGLM